MLLTFIKRTIHLNFATLESLTAPTSTCTITIHQGNLFCHELAKTVSFLLLK